MYDGQLAPPAAAESQLAMGDNCREGIGAYDHRCRAAIGVRLYGRSTERQREGITQCTKREAWRHLTPEFSRERANESACAALARFDERTGAI